MGLKLLPEYDVILFCGRHGDVMKLRLLNIILIRLQDSNSVRDIELLKYLSEFKIILKC